MRALSSVLLVGATGNFGISVCHAIAGRSSEFQRIAIFNNTARPASAEKQKTLTDLEKRGFEILNANGFDTVEPYRGFDCVVSLLGNHALHEQPIIFERAIQAGVRHFYPSEYGADLLMGQNWTQRYYRYKVDTREYLEGQGQHVANLGWTYFLLGRLTESGVLPNFGFDHRDASANIYGTEGGKQTVLSFRNAADYVVATLLDPLPDVNDDPGKSKGRRRTYRFGGETLSWKEIFESLERITGYAYRVTYLDVESAAREEAEAKREGDVDKELDASHKLIQGREGTLLPQPWYNHLFPQIKVDSFEEAATSAFQNDQWRKAYGI